MNYIRWFKSYIWILRFLELNKWKKETLLEQASKKKNTKCITVMYNTPSDIFVKWTQGISLSMLINPLPEWPTFGPWMSGFKMSCIRCNGTKRLPSHYGKKNGRKNVECFNFCFENRFLGSSIFFFFHPSWSVPSKTIWVFSYSTYKCILR